MTIEQYDCIDILGTSDDGPQLVIVDPGNLRGDERLAALQKKLQVYRQALLLEEFQAAHPQWPNATIKVCCAVEPTPEMKALSQVELDGEGPNSVVVPVIYEFIPNPFG